MSAFSSTMSGKKLRKSSSKKVRTSSSAPGKLESTMSSTIVEHRSMISNEIESGLTNFNKNVELIFGESATAETQNKFKKMVKKINKEMNKVVPSCIFQQLGIDKSLVLALIAVLYWEDEYIKGGVGTPEDEVAVRPDALVEREPRIPPHIFYHAHLDQGQRQI